jgi:hypothetical protein
MYMAILWPVAIGKSSEHVLWRKGMKAYFANRGLDINKDSRVTKREAADKVYRLYEEGMRPGNVMQRQSGFV